MPYAPPNVHVWRVKWRPRRTRFRTTLSTPVALCAESRFQDFFVVNVLKVHVLLASNITSTMVTPSKNIFLKKNFFKISGTEFKTRTSTCLKSAAPQLCHTHRYSRSTCGKFHHVRKLFHTSTAIPVPATVPDQYLHIYILLQLML